ncbi:sensor histidine kinase [Guggenheimella bovis]
MMYIIEALIFLVIGYILYKNILEKSKQELKNLLVTHSNDVESYHKDMRGWRHDYLNQLQTMKAYLSLKQYDELKNYLDGMEQDLREIDMLVESGNTMIDAILNSKLTLAMEKGIDVYCTANVPKELAFDSVDLGIILGNLLSNAIEAQEYVKEKFIRIYIQTMKGHLYINVTNSMDGMNPSLVTRKSKREHGFGIRRIDHSVKELSGTVNRKQDEGVFSTEIFLPNVPLDGKK